MRVSAPFGYRQLSDGSLIPHFREMSILKEARELRNRDGFVPAYVAGWLNARNKLNRGKLWTAAAVGEVLSGFASSRRHLVQ